MTTDEEHLLLDALSFSINDDEWDGEQPQSVDVVLLEDAKQILQEQRAKVLAEVKAEWDNYKQTTLRYCLVTVPINERFIRETKEFEKVFEDGK